jgi:hypothetical protein
LYRLSDIQSKRGTRAIVFVPSADHDDGPDARIVARGVPHALGLREQRVTHDDGDYWVLRTTCPPNEPV